MKKKKVDVKKLTFEAQAILKDTTEEELAFLSDVAASKYFDNGIGLLNKMIERNMAAVFRHPEKDPLSLAIFKANARGQVGAIALFLQLTKGAEGEKDRRGKRGATPRL